jgi:hypothetical protein
LPCFLDCQQLDGIPQTHSCTLNAVHVILMRSQVFSQHLKVTPQIFNLLVSLDHISPSDVNRSTGRLQGVHWRTSKQ